MKKYFPFSLILLGLIFSFFTLLVGEEKYCFTEGCALFSSFSIGGISLWAVSIVYFSFLFITKLLHKEKVFYLFVLIAVLIDVFLLFVMSLIAPCFNCLIIGSVLAILFYTTVYPENFIKKNIKTVILCVWGFFFVGNLTSVFHEIVQPWALIQASDEQTKIFFSPSCAACNKLVRNADQMGDVSWYPVAENWEDVLVVNAMIPRVQEGKRLSEALLEAKKEVLNHPSSWSFFIGYLQLKLWKNASIVFEGKNRKIPFIIVNGVPSYLLSNFPEKSSRVNSYNSTSCVVGKPCTK